MTAPKATSPAAAAIESIQRDLAARDFAKAFDACGAALQQFPNQPTLHFIMAGLFVEARDPTRAARFATQAARLAAGNALYWAFAAKCELGVDNLEAAGRLADRALALQPAQGDTWDTLAFVFSRLARHETALECAKKAVEASPQNEGYWLNLGAEYVVLGDLAAAKSAYERAVALAPAFAPAYVSLVQLSRQTPDRNYVAQLDRLLSASTDPAEALELGHALGKSYEDLADYTNAMRAWSRGKNAARAASGYRFEQEPPIFDAAKRTYGKDLPAEKRPGFAPIFVVGLPRTGTTLTDRIISSHRDVESGGELPSFPQTTFDLVGRPAGSFFSAKVFEAATKLDVRALAQGYEADARKRVQTSNRLLDKLPVNVLYAGLICRALPSARIVCLRRDPLDSVLSNYRQLFSHNQPLYHHSYSLEDCARHYLLFADIVEYWRRVLPPEQFFVVDYEALVADQERQTRQLLEFCNLDWDPSCLAFERNAQPVATPSSAQVREAINTNAVARWRRFGALLDPARRILQAGGVLEPEHAQ